MIDLVQVTERGTWRGSRNSFFWPSLGGDSSWSSAQKPKTWQQSCCIKAQETCIYTQATQGRMLSDRDFTLLPALLASLLGGSLHKSLPTITSASACRAAWPQHRQILIPAEEILISQLLHHSSVQWSFAAPPACLGASTTECWREDVRQKPAEFLACQKTKVYPLHFY